MGFPEASRREELRTHMAPLIGDLDITITREKPEGFYPDRISPGLWRVQADPGCRGPATGHDRSGVRARPRQPFAGGGEN
jgi:hypothetical protein